ncbi:hypothetical protein HW555_012504 [Spodoptera exigua]|uniref:Peptidase aspartic putative domain-containing protein n=2 Tax=Spodoptera exigua TaxID=7107 RepID=A0A835KZJ8_SPOEX|nr:hypothetical protein HW555_012504 [Spodoptera exigua]
MDMDKKLLSNTPEDDDAQLNTFKKRRAGHKGKVTIFKNYIESLNSKKKIALTELEILQLKNRLEVYKTLEHDFDVNQTLIEDIVGVSDEQLKEREQFDSEYQNQLALAMQLMRDSESTGITDGSESSAALRQLIDTVSKNLRALDSLDEKTQFWDTLIIYLVASKLDSVTLRHWEVYKNTLNAKPVLQNLKTYLKDRADLLQTLEEKHKQNHVDIKSNKPAQNQTSTSRSPSCPLCKAQHYLFSCPDFKQMTVEKRIEKVSKMNVCSNCLYPGHEKKTCRGGTCKYCSLKHNTLLHIEKPKSSSITCTSTQQTSVLLSTTLVDVLGSDGTFHTARCLLDNGSTSSYVTKNLCTRLNLTLESINGSVSGINGQKTNILYRTNIQIKSLHNSFTMNSSCLVLDEISNLIPNIHQLSRFWELDSLSDSQNTDPCDADACEVIFKQTTTRQSDGRFVVTIPFKMSPDCLGNSYYQAKKRFLCLENRTDDESTLLEIATGVNTELKKYQFPLRKWKTNCPAVLRKLGFDNDSKDNILKHSTPQSWYYIPSKQNPADIITKCTNAQQLINSDLWFSGPDFLRNDDNKCWPEQPRHLSVSDLPEIRSQSHLTHTDENSFIHNYSNFNKLTRIVAYMLRFLNNARYQLAKIIQQHSFPDEYLLLLNNKKLPVGHKLNSLNPFLDEFQLIRVGGSGVAPWTYFENLSWTRRSGARSRYKNQQGNDKKRL